MPREQIYDREAAVRPAPAQSFASPEAFGAGVGRGMEQLGRTLTDIEVRNRAQDKADDREAENAKAAVDFATGAGELSKIVRQRQEEAQPDAAGHVEAVTNEAKAFSERFLGGIKDARVRNRWAGRVAELATRTVDDEDAWSRGRKSEATLTNLRDADGARQMSLETNPDEAIFNESIKDLHASAESLNQTPAVQKKYVEEQEAAYAVSFAQGLIRSNATLGQAYVESGALDAYLRDPKLKLALLNHADVGVQAQEVEARRQGAFAEKAARDDISGFRTKFNAGVRFDDAEFDTRIAVAEHLGDQSLATQLRVDKTENTILRVTEKWAPADWAASIGTLEAKGDKRTAAEDVQLATLKKHRGASEARFNQRPREAAAASGLPPPEVDWSNPTREQASALVRWHDAYKAVSGATGDFILPDDVAAQFRERAHAGPAGQIDVAAQARSLFGVRDGARVLRQVDPQDKDMQLYVGLPERTAQWLKRGSEALKRNDKLFDKDAAQDIFAEYAPAIPPDLRTPLWNAAKAITAGLADEQGETELKGDDFDRQFRAGIHRAAGALGVVGDPKSRQGGFVNWNGGKVWIPQSETPDSFARKLSRAKPVDWINANSNAAGDGPGGAPHYMGPDGKPHRLDETQGARLREYRVVTTPVIGVYQLENPRTGGRLIDKNGRAWHFKAAKLP